MTSELSITVRSTELDSLGHVNNAKYLEYLEWGRFEWLRQSGVPLDLLGTSGVGTAIVNVNVNFRNEARLSDELRVRARLVHIGTSSLQIGQEILGADGRRVCDGLVTLAIFDTRTRRSTPISLSLREALEPLISAAPDHGSTVLPMLEVAHGR
ncbi:MAG: acyl-CoA thioesterase [Gemmatimonadota bacterium]|jgi:YbgC/YbaW family acyl-CoA thioester hydrolase|nr:acyl-CoA thioesterase [Gemmatimonadota bacterium]